MVQRGALGILFRGCDFPGWFIDDSWTIPKTFFPNDAGPRG